MKWAVLLLTVLLAGCGGPPSDDPVRVAAAADLKFALDEIISDFTQAKPDIEVTPTYGSSGTFFQQIGNGAPFDLFLSADVSYPEKLVADGFAEPGDVFDYAVGRIVVWARNDSPVEPTGLASLADPAARQVSIANPEHAPYGVAAVAAMQNAGVYEQVREHLVLGENVAQAAEFLQSGNADVGVIALSLAFSPQMQDAGTFIQVPLSAYPRLEQGGVVLSDSPAAREFRDFLLSDDGTEVLKRYGFFLPER